MSKINKGSVSLIATSLLALGITMLVVFFWNNSFDLRSLASGSSQPYIISANIDFNQTVDVNRNGKMNLRVVERLDTNPTDTLHITISDIVLSSNKLRTNKYQFFVFATCKTNSGGINWWGYPTRTWILTAIPISQQTIEADYKNQVETRLLDESFPESRYFRDLTASGARCNIELGLKGDRMGAADMRNYAWYPYVDTNYFATHPLDNHPYSFDLFPENVY